MDDGQLHAYLDGELADSGDDPVELERHFAECPACAGRLEAIRALRAEGRAFLAGGAPLVVEQPPFDEVIARSRRPAAAPRRLPRYLARGAWAASLVAALGAGWLARGLLRDQTPERVAGVEQGERLAGAPAASPDRTATVMAEPVPAPPPPLAAARERQTAPALAGPAVVMSGRVTDADGRGVADAAVGLEGVGAATRTAADGSFALPVPAARVQREESLTLAVSAAGMSEVKRVVPADSAGADTLQIRVEPMSVALEGVAATGYATQRRRDLTSAPVPAAPPPPAAAASAPAGRAAPAPAWTAIDRAAAARLLGRAPLTLPGTAVLGMERGVVEGRATVRVRQALEGGGVLTLLQQASAEPRLQRGSAAAPDAVRLESAPAPAAANAESEVTALRGAVLVTARAPLPADSLRALLERLR